jgi:Uma2 family endonuclease
MVGEIRISQFRDLIMIAAREHFPKFTPEEYFAWEERQQVRHEYIDGEVYAMTGGTLNHGRIALNFASLLKNHLRGSGCQLGNSDCRVNIHASTRYVYPDVSVTCDERDKTNTQYITYPCVIVEVTSSSTEAYDRGNKFKLYRRNPNLQEYVLVDAEAMEIELFRKADGDKWSIINYEPGDVVELTSIKLSFLIEQAYEDILFLTV